YDEARKINPRIVYAQGSSWGPRGPWVTRPSRDTLAQARGLSFSSVTNPRQKELAVACATTSG
ncbi:MAG: CoA transferase, partial [Acidobacteriia bacterium]|nr:CoA transferase [Terriglobia bacterium]